MYGPSVLIFLLRANNVLSVNTCVVDMCTEASGNVAVALYDTVGGDCSGWAMNTLTSACGINFQETKYLVDCNGIYSWSGAYWRAAGCDGLGWPCGSSQICGSSVLSVCQLASSSTSAPGATIGGTQQSTATPGQSSSDQTASPKPTKTPFPETSGGIALWVIVSVLGAMASVAALVKCCSDS